KSAVARLKTVLPNCEIGSDFVSDASKSQSPEQPTQQTTPPSSGAVEKKPEVARKGDLPAELLKGMTGPRDPATDDVNRRLAVWVLKLGGVAITGQGESVASVKDIPASSFRITAISFDSNTQIDDGVLAELAAFKPPHLNELLLQGTRIT